MNKPKFPNKRLVLVASVILCLGLIAGALIAQALTPSTTFWISPGVYPGAPSYTIWAESGSYFAKDSLGHTVYSGTNASYVIQNVVNAIPATGISTKGGGNIYFLTEHYDLDHAINLTGKRGITLLGEGTPRLGTNYAVVLSLNNGSNCQVFFANNTSADHAYGITIKHFFIYGNKIGQTSDVDAIFIGYTHQVYIEDLYIYQAKRNAICIDSCEIVRITNCAMSESGADGIDSSGNLCSIIETDIEKAGTHGIHIGMDENIIRDNIIAYCGYGGVQGTGIFIDTGDKNTIDGNVIAANLNDGITINGQNNTVTNNKIYVNTDSGIYVTASFNIISGNHLLNNDHWGISESAPADYNIIFGCSSFNNDIGGIETNGINTHTNLCWNNTDWLP